MNAYMDRYTTLETGAKWFDERLSADAPDTIGNLSKRQRSRTGIAWSAELLFGVAFVKQHFLADIKVFVVKERCMPIPCQVCLRPGWEECAY